MPKKKRLLELVVLVGAVYGVALYAERQRESKAVAPPAFVPAVAVAAPEPIAPPPSPAAAIQLPETANFTPSEADLMRKIHAHFATGDFVGALKLADDETLVDARSVAFQKWINEQMPTLLTGAGWSRLKLGDCEEATTYLRRAEVLRRAPETAKGLAVCYFKLRNLASAREQFTYYLEKQGDDQQMRVLYADTLESEGRYDDAVRALETAAISLPDDQALKQRLTSMRGKAKESLSQLIETSQNFRLSYHAGDHEDLVSGVLETLEAALSDYMDQYDFRLPPSPIEVILYPAEDFKAVVSYGPDWAEGLFDGRIRIPVRQGLGAGGIRDLELVLRHELVHALLALMSDGRQIPPWFDEGLAQRLSCAKRGLCGRFEFPPTPGAFLAVPSFLSPYTAFTAVKASRAYRQSLYLILVLEHVAGDEAMKRIIGKVGPSTDLSSDSLLAPVNLTFASLQATAAREWKSRQPLNPL